MTVSLSSFLGDKVSTILGAIQFPDHLSRLAQELTAGHKIAYCSALWVSTDGIAAPFFTNLQIAPDLDRFMNVGNTLPASCFAYDANLFTNRDIWPEDMAAAADWHLWRKILRRTHFNIGFCPEPSTLHFSATRKKSRHSSMPELLTMLYFAEEWVWWPCDLKLDTKNHATEQHAYAGLLLAEGSDWIERARRGALLITNRLAEYQLQQSDADNSAAMVAVAKRHKSLELELHRLNDQLLLHHETIQAMKESNSWRMSAPLRAIMRVARRLTKPSR